MRKPSREQRARIEAERRWAPASERHCWEDSPDGEATCMLPDGHPGPHKFTPDGQITLSFLPEGGEGISSAEEA